MPELLNTLQASPEVLKTLYFAAGGAIIGLTSTVVSELFMANNLKNQREGLIKQDRRERAKLIKIAQAAENLPGTADFINPTLATAETLQGYKNFGASNLLNNIIHRHRTSLVWRAAINTVVGAGMGAAAGVGSQSIWPTN